MNYKYNFIYITTNLINGKQYVGEHSTIDLDSSKTNNYKGSGRPYLERAFKKYGRKNFKKEILEFFDTKKEAQKFEKKYINQFNTLVPNGYNISPTGGSHSKGWMNELSKGKLKKPRSKSVKEKISKTLKGHHVSEETINKIKETKRKNGTNIAWNKGEKTGPLSDSHKKKIGQSNIGKHTMSQEHREKIRAVMSGRSLSENHKQKLIEYQANLNKPKIKCPYCKNYINSREYKRGHRKRCDKNPKNKNQIEELRNAES